MSLLLVVPDRSGLGPSGGDRYDASVAAAWRAAGHRVRVVAVPGAWPWPDGRALAELARVLDEDDAPVLLDGLVAGAAPAQVEAAASWRRVIALVHSVLSAGAGLRGEDALVLDSSEARALRAADRVVATSRWLAAELGERYGLEGVVVAQPGVDRAPLAAGAGISLGAGAAPQLLSLGAVTQVKNHAVLIRALAEVVDLPWSLVAAGPTPDPRHLRTLQHDADYLGLTGRITWPGPLGGEELEHVWERTDLLVHVSRYEAYGMVVAEAHARGIPTVVGAGTGAVEALEGDGEDEPPGVAVAPDDVAAVAAVLREWLTDGAVRSRWREAALLRRHHQRTWRDTATVIAAASGLATR